MAEKPFSPEQREEVFRDWATRKYDNVNQLAHAHGVGRVEMIYRWISRYEWRERRGEYLETVFSEDKERGRAVQDANDMHMQGWRLLYAQTMNLIQPRTNESTGKLMPVNVALLDKASSIMLRLQKGQRLAIGSDLSLNEDHSKRVRVTVGESGSSSDLKVLAKEVLDQHEKADQEDQEDKKASAG